jgi:hypothetical protein
VGNGRLAGAFALHARRFVAGGKPMTVERLIVIALLGWIIMSMVLVGFDPW